MILESVASISEVAAEDIPPTSHPLPVTNVFREDVVAPCTDPRAGAVGAPAVEEPAVRGAADPGGRAVTHDLTRRTAAELADALGAPGRRRASRSPRPSSTGSPRWTARCTRSCTSTPRARWRRPGPPTSAGPTASSCSRARRGPDRGQGRARHRGAADHVRLEDPRGLGPAVRRHGGRAGSRRPGCRSSARPTWTSSRWAPRPSTRRTAPPATRGTSTGSPAAPAAAPPRRSPPSGAAGPRHRHRRLDPPARRGHRHGRRQADLRRGLPLRARGAGQLARPGGPGDPHRARRGAAARGHRRARPARLHEHRPAGARW